MGTIRAGYWFNFLRINQFPFLNLSQSDPVSCMVAWVGTLHTASGLGVCWKVMGALVLPKEGTLDGLYSFIKCCFY